MQVITRLTHPTLPPSLPPYLSTDVVVDSRDLEGLEDDAGNHKTHSPLPPSLPPSLPTCPRM